MSNIENSEHTKGPWYDDTRGYVWRRRLSELYEYGGDVAGDKPIAFVSKGWYGENVQGYPVEANTALIAAAPDLLEFAEYVLSLHTGGLIQRKAQEVVNKAKRIEE